MPYYFMPILSKLEKYLKIYLYVIIINKMENNIDYKRLYELSENEIDLINRTINK